MGYKPFQSTLYIATALSIGLTGPVVAQTAAQASDTDLSEIVVTARRVEERLQDVPISITVVTAQELSKQNVLNAVDLANFTPSLTVNTNYGSENTTFAIRGFTQEQGTAPAVGVYFGDVIAPRGASNGVPSGDGAGPGSFFDLQNIQVLKGPQGTLFGRNTTGGDVLLVPQKPTGVLEGYVEGSVGNYDLNGVQAVVNVPVNDSLRVRLGVDHQERNGYLNNTSGIGPRDFDDVNYTSARLSVVVDITPDIENYTIASMTNSSSNGSVQKLVAAAPVGLGEGAFAQLAATGSNFYDIQQNYADPASIVQNWQVINTTTWNASDNLTVKNIASYAELKDSLSTPLFGTNFSIPAIPGFTSTAYQYGFANITPAPGEPSSHERTITEEFRLNGKALNDALTWQGGLYFDASRPIGVVGSQSPEFISCTNSSALQCTDIVGFAGELAEIPHLAPGTPISSVLNTVTAGEVNLTTGQTAFRDAAAYAQGSYKFNELFKLTAGARYTTDDETQDNLQKTFIFLSPAPTATNPLPLPTIPFGFCTNPLTDGTACRSHYSTDSHAPTWLIDFDYTPTQDVLTYAKYSRGYRAGTIAANVTAPYNYVQPEKVDAYEVGAKTTFAEPVHGVFDVAAFYNDFRNQQLQLGFNPAPGAHVISTAAPINAGKSRIFGGEVDASISPFRGFRFDVDYAYLDTRILEIPTFPQPAGALYTILGAQRAGDQLSLSPHNKVSATANYTLPIPEVVGKVSLGVNFVHTDKMSTDAYYQDHPSPYPSINTLGVLPPTNLLNLNVSWESIANKPIDLLLFATNLTNVNYYTNFSGLGTAVNFETGQVGEPRMYGARVRIRFGRH